MAGCHGGGRVDDGWLDVGMGEWIGGGADWLNDARGNLGDVSLGATVSLVSVSAL